MSDLNFTISIVMLCKLIKFASAGFTLKVRPQSKFLPIYELAMHKIVSNIKYTVHCAWTFTVYIHVIVCLITVRILCMIVIYFFSLFYFQTGLWMSSKVTSSHQVLSCVKCLWEINCNKIWDFVSFGCFRDKHTLISNITDRLMSSKKNSLGPVPRSSYGRW